MSSQDVAVERIDPTPEFPYRKTLKRTASGRLLSSLFELSTSASKGKGPPKGKGAGKAAGKGNGKPTLSARDKSLVGSWYSLAWNFYVERKDDKLLYREETGEPVEVVSRKEADGTSSWEVTLPDVNISLHLLSGVGDSAVLQCVRRSSAGGEVLQAEARRKYNVFITEVLPNAVVVKNHSLAAGDEAQIERIPTAGDEDAPFSLEPLLGSHVYVRPLPGNPSGRLELYESAALASAERRRLESPCLELQPDSFGSLSRVQVYCPSHGYKDGCSVVISGIVDKSKTEAKPWDALNAEFVVSDAQSDTFLLKSSSSGAPAPTASEGAAQEPSYLDGSACLAPSGKPYLFDGVSAKVCSLAGRWCFPEQTTAGKLGKLIPSRREFGTETGMSQLLTSVDSVFAQKELESLTPEDVDMTVEEGNESEKRVCPRCEQKIPVTTFDSHWSSHSSEILPRLFLGGDRNAWNDAEVTKRTRISHILNVAASETSTEELLRYYCAEKEVTFRGYKGMPFQDSEGFDMLTNLDEAVQFVRDALDADSSHRVLVHCVQGISRSASVVIAYLMGPPCSMSLLDAWQHVKSCRAVARPNPSFIQQLSRFELRMRPELSEPTLTKEDVWPPGETYLDLEKMGDVGP